MSSFSDEIFIIGCSVNYNFQCNQWRKCHQKRVIAVSVKYVHGCVVQLYQQFSMETCDFLTHILQDCFIGSGQLYDYSSSSEVTLKDMGKIGRYKTPMEHKKARTVWLLLVVFCNSRVQSTTMTSSNVNIFRVTGPSWVESTGHWWISLTKASDAELWCFLWSAPEQTIEKTTETPAIWDAIALIMMSLSWRSHFSFTAKATIV